jgi:uncharacterized protein
MRRWAAVLIIFLAACAQARDDGTAHPERTAPCSEAWYRFLAEKVATGDGRGHGPDVGTAEWKSVIEFRLGIRNQPDLPPRDGEAWGRYIDRIVRERYAVSEIDRIAGGAATAPGPSYPCDKAATGSIEAMICKDHELSALDRKLSGIYTAAARKAANEHSPVLRAEQRGWIKGRDACWKHGDPRGCVRDAYQRRIAELKARYQLVPGQGPVRFICEGNPAHEVVVTFYPTDPPTLIAEHGDSVSLMVRQPAGSGAKYQGRNETFWGHRGEASITWGYGATAMRCTKSP